ncbi:MAG: hypothetical protein PHQ27_03035 [Victivallales bacterium]|nr:hypothetical protein [Victivallales bacterium]
MKIADILGKVVSGTALTPEENEFLANYREPELKDRIPKSRLDQELSRKKELEQRLEEMARRVDEYENRDLSESEKNRKIIDNLNRKIETLSRERDEIQVAKTELETRSRIAAIAGEFNFDDRDYLEFLIKRDRQDVNDPEAMKSYLDGLQQSCPRHFRIDAAPGSGGSNNLNPGQSDFSAARADGDIDRMIASAPAV